MPAMKNASEAICMSEQTSFTRHDYDHEIAECMLLRREFEIEREGGEEWDPTFGAIEYI